MSITNYEVSGGPEGHHAVSGVTSSSGGGIATAGDVASLTLPTCLVDQDLRHVDDMSSTTSRFYVGDTGLCLVEAVDMSDSPGINLDEVLERVERKLIQFALEKTGGARAGAARLMGISRSRLYRRLHALGLDNGASDNGGNGGYPTD